MHSEPPIDWPIRNSYLDYVPGLAVVSIITAAAFLLHELVLLSPMMIAIILGIAVNAVIGPRPALSAGTSLAGKRLLRISVALLGLQLTFDDIVDIGLGGVAVAGIALISTYLFTLLLGRLLKVDRRLTHLLAAGTSICGASAIAASNTIIRGRDEDVSYAIGCITIFGTISMLCLPLLQEWLNLAPRVYGVWVGASIHEVAQVVGAAFQGGQEAAHVGVVTKLTRVMMLAPLIVIVGSLARSRGSYPTADRPAIMPAFILAFIVLAAANSFDLVPGQLHKPLVAVTPVLLTAALGALGLGTDFKKLKAEGAQPLLLAMASGVFVALSALLSGSVLL